MCSYSSYLIKLGKFILFKPVWKTRKLKCRKHCEVTQFYKYQKKANKYTKLIIKIVIALTKLIQYP